MKPRTRSIAAAATVCLLALTARPYDAPAAGSPTPTGSVTTSPSPGSGKGEGKKKNKDRDPNAPPPTPKPAKAPKDIPFPLPKGNSARVINIPEMGLNGELLSRLMSAKATRIDNEHVQMEEMTLDLNHPDGKQDFHVVMPASIFNLQTHIITSEQPVSVHTQEFELTGEKMEFNTVERSGKLVGHVRMLVHNLKQVAGQTEPTPKPE